MPFQPTQSRLDNECEMGHTALYPGKDNARAEWAHQVDRDDDIITVSHAALGTLNTLRHRGRILVCDMDQGVANAAYYIRVGDPKNGKPSDYPGLCFLPEMNCDIREAVETYLGAVGSARRLGAVDLDLTGTIEQVWPIAHKVCETIKSHTYASGTLVLLTYRNGRDNQGRNATGKRVAWLGERLPWYARVIWSHPYRSDWIDRYARRIRGSAMTLAAIKIR